MLVEIRLVYLLPTIISVEESMKYREPSIFTISPGYYLCGLYVPNLVRLQKYTNYFS